MADAKKDAPKETEDTGGSNAPVQGTAVPRPPQSGEGTTAGEAGKDQPDVRAEDQGGSGKQKGVKVHVKTPMTVNLTEEEAKAAGDEKRTSYPLTAGINHVPKAVADHWFVKGNLADED